MESVAWLPQNQPGCANCYMHRRDESVGKDPESVYKTSMFDLPVRKARDGSYKLAGGRELFTCGTSDFFLPEADMWRREAWRFVRSRPDITFLIITKRIQRFMVSLPDDWGGGYGNVRIGCTVENQQCADERLPVFLSMPIAHRVIICEPLLERIELSRYLGEGVEELVAGGESGMDARVCDYRWVLDLRRQCVDKKTPFWFKQTGRLFLKDGKRYTILKRFQHSQARKAGINYS